MWHWDYANGETTYYDTITEYGFQTKKRFAQRSYDNIMIFLKLGTEEQLKLQNYYAEYITGQNYLMKSKDTSKIAIHAKERNQTVTRPTVSYNHWKYQINHGNL